jgi:ABC-2 type transport system ATP-binding protein
MQRRIGLAQAMINDPAFLILDEPTSGLDPLGCREVKDLILTLKKRGKTVLITSHLLSDVEDICDRVIILYGGKIRAEGALDNLLTVNNETRIMTPELPKAAMDQLLSILRANLDGDEFRIDHPRRTLEEFFLDVIATAKRESVETSGVVSGGRIADYLTSDSSDKNAVLENLLAAPAAAAPEVKVAETVEAKAETSASERIAEVLDSQEVAPQKTASSAPDTTAEKAENLAEANKKLDSLLGNLDGTEEK